MPSPENEILDDLIVAGSVTCDSIISSGTLDGRDVSADGATLDAHVADTSDPHGSTMTVTVKVVTPEIESPGNLTLDMNSASTTTLSVTNAGAGTANLSLDNDLSLGGAIELGHASDTTLARSAAGRVTIESKEIYTAGGTADVALGDGGTGASLADPNADRILFWDDSETTSAWLTATNGVEISTTNLQMTSNQRTSVITFIIDGGGGVITTGIKGDIEVPFSCTLVSATLLADASGAIVVDIWKDDYSAYPPTDADSMPGGSGTPPTISASGVKSQDTSFTNWSSTSITAGQTIRVNVDSCTTITRCTLSLKVLKT